MARVVRERVLQGRSASRQHSMSKLYLTYSAKAAEARK